ncbi:CsgG/HfaB family protein [Novosphingobium resinovorum]|uniref:CsgG/HfaB family protein n=1 Tax=Novosphingobium resinovorum TaxID=158500 RepID=UPI002ED3DB60|nr:CsgG/HfaB family protein [Novosphingobium resinovorum]
MKSALHKFGAGALGALAVLSATPALADQSSGRKLQDKGQQQIPICTKNLGTVSIVEPDNQWWREFSLGSPEAILKVFVQKSGCFTMVNRGRSLQSSAMERALAEQGELQKGSNIGKGQIKAADYFLQPDIVSTNNNSGGGGLGGVLGGVGGLFGRGVGAIAGGLNVKKGEANVTLSVVNARTTVEEALTEGYARKSDVSFGAGGGGFFGGTFGGVGGGGYQNTQIGQIIVLAYLDAYTKLVTQLGGLPVDASAAAPKAR